MPNIQTQGTAPQHQARRRKKQPSYYRLQEVGEAIGLETKLSKDGTLIFRISPLEDQRKTVRMNGKEVDRIQTQPKPGRWMAMTDLSINRLFDHLEELEGQAKEQRLYAEADRHPLRHRPFQGIDLGQILVEGVEDAFDPPPPQKKARPKKRPQQKRQLKKPMGVSWRTVAIRRLGELTQGVRAARQRLRSVHQEV